MTIAMRNGILPLLCLTTTFCGPHADEEQVTEYADGIESLADPRGLRQVHDTPIVPGTTAGYLPGTSEVTATGEFTYRIDMDVPPGRAGMEPAISLKYGSRSQNGLLGVGWSLDGFSEIHRCAKTFAQDGTADGIDFDNDSLCLDGKKLVALGAGGNEYRTEQDSMSRILAQGPADKPASFVVYRKDGHILEYFPITPAKVDWLLYKERDRAGNEIRFEYQVIAETTIPTGPGVRPGDAPATAAVEYYPSAIHYTFQRNTGDAAKRKVVFAYEDRPDPLFAYLGGVKLATTKRLSAIEMHAPNPTDTKLVWRYTLGYTAGTPRSQLASVKKCGALGGCLLAIEFTYEDPKPVRFQRAYQADEPLVGNTLVVFDADGNGKDDVLYQGIGNEFYLRKTPRDGKNALSQRILVRGDEHFDHVSLMDTNPVDIDADGIAELSGLVAEKEFRLFRWNDDTQSFQSIWAPIPVSADASWKKCKVWPMPEAAFFVDFNGDALPDMIKTIDLNPAAHSYQPKWHYWLNQGDSFGPPNPIGIWMDPPFCYEDSRRSRSVTVDLRGDHRGTLIVDTGSMQYSRFETVALQFDDTGKIAKTQLDLPGLGRRIFADLNGDGLRDWIAEHDGIQVRWNTGREFILDPSPFWPHGKDVEGDWHAADMDSDGDDELLVMKGGPKPELAIFRYAPKDHAATMQVIKGIPPGQIGDFNGDGFIDVVSWTEGRDLQVFEQVAVSHGLLKAIRDEHGDSPREEIQYGTHLPGPSTCRYPQRCIRYSIPVVRRHSRTNLGARVYTFEAPHSDLRGRGFLGFGKVRVWDPDRGAETTTTYDHATRIHETYPYAMLPKEVLEVTPILEQPAPGKALPQPATARARVKRRLNVYDAKWLHDDRTYFVHPASWTSWEWEQDVGIDWKDEHIQVRRDPRVGTLRKRTGTYRVDDYDNVLEETLVTEHGVKRAITTTYEVREKDWLVGLVHSRDVATDGLPPRRVEYAYDDRGLLTQTRIEPNDPDPDIPETITFTRSADDGLVSAVTRQAAGQPARTVSVDFGDDERVFPIRVWNDLNHTTQLAYHPAYGTLGQVIDANSVHTRRSYDDLGRLRTVIPQGGAKVTLAYEVALANDERVIGSRVSVRDETGSEGFVVYDPWERPVLDVSRGFDGEWIYRRTDYDALGNVSLESRPGRGGPANARTEYRYDSLDRLLEARLPDGARTRQRHTFFESHTWDAENHESYVVRDADDRIIRSVQILGSTELPTTYRYREFNLIDKITDPKGNVIEYDYDQRGRRTRLSHPDRGVTTYLYNGYGDLRQTTDALNHVSTYHHDTLGRVTRSEDDDGVTELVWDASTNGIGSLSVTTSPDGTRRDYHYDRAGRPERLDWTVDGERFSIDAAYDPLGRLSTLAYPEAPGRPRLTVRHTYNTAGYLNEIADVSGKSLWRVDGRSLDGALARGTYGNGLTVARAYDDVTGRLKEINAGSVYALAYDYYANGFVKSRSDSVKARHEAFGYDSLDRLQSWRLEGNGGTQVTDYGFDDLGNLTKVLVNGQTVEEYQYGGLGAGPHALTASSVHGSFAFDAAGRRTDGGGKQIQYTDFDLPREITTANGTTVFAYDATGTRVKKAGPGGTTVSIGDLYERRTDPSGVKHVFYVHSGDEIVAQLVYDQGSRSTETQYVLTDALGSVGVVTDEAGRELERRYFEPFGQRVDEGGASLQSSSPTDVRVGFTGHRHDDELGLINMRGRMYDPATRRFLTPDPLALFGQESNPYAYARGSPLSMVDPSGYDVIRRDVPSWSIDVDTHPWLRDSIPPPPQAGPGVIPGRWLIHNDQANVPPPQGLTFSSVWSKPPLSTPAAAKPEVDGRSALQYAAEFFRKRYADRDVLLQDLSIVATIASFVPGPIGVVGMVASAALGAAQVKRGIETGDPWRIAGGMLTGLPMLGVVKVGKAAGAATGTIGVTGKVGEQVLKALGGESQVFLRTSQGARIVDQLVKGVAHESKVGYQWLSKDIARQVARDVELIRTREVQAVTWHFFRSPITGQIGPSEPLRQLLQKSGIGIVIH